MSKSGKKSSSGEKGKKTGSSQRSRKSKSTQKTPRELAEKTIEILPVIEYAIYEIDQIFKNQGDTLTDDYLVESLEELAHTIKAKSFETLLQEVRDELIEDPDIIHWNIVSRIGDHIEENELNYSSKDILNAIEDLIDTIKLQMSDDNPRAYLSFLSEIMRGAKFDKFKRPGEETDFGISPDTDDYFDDEENY
jgi:hypothetical protein